MTSKCKTCGHEIYNHWTIEDNCLKCNCEKFISNQGPQVSSSKKAIVLNPEDTKTLSDKIQRDLNPYDFEEFLTIKDVKDFIKKLKKKSISINKKGYDKYVLIKEKELDKLAGDKLTWKKMNYVLLD